MHALGLEFGSAAQLSKRPGSVWNCLWGNALKRSPGIIRKSRVSYPGPGFLSSATWPMLPKKHYNGLNQTVTPTLNQRRLQRSSAKAMPLFSIVFHILCAEYSGVEFQSTLPTDPATLKNRSGGETGPLR